MIRHSHLGLVIGIIAAVLWADRGRAYAAPPADERYRPQFHFTAEKGWLNDPNGLVYSDGEYHLFFQHNPNGTDWVNELSWGHAISRDLVHWEQIADVLAPSHIGGGKIAGSWSGSAVVDEKNTAGFGAGDVKPIILIWTATGVGQCIAYSTDHGRTFKSYDHNPVIPMPPGRNGDWDRDPKVYFYEPTGKWVMALSISGKGLAFYSSPDLKKWTRESLSPDLWECPDYFELPVDGNGDRKKWVIWDASGKYFIGSFDGRAFTKESGPFLIDYGHNYYAAQTWNNAPDGRRLGIAWMREGRYPGMPFNQQMSVPFELTLRTLPRGLRLTKLPVKEIEQLRYDTKEVQDRPLGRGNVFPQVSEDALDIECALEPRGAGKVVLKACGATVEYVPGLLKCQGFAAPLEPTNGRITLRVLLDRTSVEVFGNDGAASISATFLPPDTPSKPELFTEQGQSHLLWLRVHRMQSPRFRE